jgi:DNA-binding MarR family transcriptional regulator
MEPQDLDLPTLAGLAGSGTTRLLLERIADAGYLGVLPSHGYVIQLLVEGEPTISMLAEALGITQQGASKQVGELERLGYVERVSVPGDQRVRKVRLTEAGRGVLEAGRQARAELEAQIVAKVGPRNVTAAKKALVALLEIEGLSDRVRTRTVPAPPS